MKYQGIVRDGEGITGICFERYEKTIADARLEDDCERVLKELRNAVDHLHPLGFIHCDINHHNVMIDLAGSAILFDFDSCSKEGGVRGGGTVGCSKDWDDRVASKELDFYALEHLEVYIRTGSFGVKHSAEEIAEAVAAIELAKQADEAAVAAEQDSAPSAAGEERGEKRAAEAVA